MIRVRHPAFAARKPTELFKAIRVRMFGLFEIQAHFSMPCWEELAEGLCPVPQKADDTYLLRHASKGEPQYLQRSFYDDLLWSTLNGGRVGADPFAMWTPSAETPHDPRLPKSVFGEDTVSLLPSHHVFAGVGVSVTACAFRGVFGRQGFAMEKSM